MSRRNFRYVLIVLGLLLLALSQSSFVPRGSDASHDLRVIFMDVGQGDAILLVTPQQHYVLVDGGPDATILSRLGKELPFNTHRLSLVVASHNHADHITGLNAVLDRYDADKIWISGAIHTTNEYLKLLDHIHSKQIPTEVVWKGTQTDIDGVHLDVLFPLSSMEGTRPEDQHDATIVIRATYGSQHFLFTGDLNEGHEQQIVDSGQVVQAEVVKVPHHGSGTGLLPAFLAAVGPQQAVIQVGTPNSYGHPAVSTLRALQAQGSTVWRNDVNGTIRMNTDGTVVRVTADRSARGPD